MTLKIGKMKYLPLLDFTSNLTEERTLLIEPLANAFEEIKKKADERIKLYEARLKNEPDEDYDFGMSHHTFIEDQIVDIAYEFHLQRGAVASSLIMVSQSYLHSKFQNILSAHSFFKLRKGFMGDVNPKSLQTHYFSLGEKVDGVPWAEAVKAASNYVRHYEEWNVSSTKITKSSTGDLIIEKLTDLISKLDKKQQGTAQTLHNLGIPEEDIFDKRKNLSEQIVEKLSLNNPAEFSRRTTVWLEEVMKDLHSKFDQLDT